MLLIRYFYIIILDICNTLTFPHKKRTQETLNRILCCLKVGYVFYFVKSKSFPFGSTLSGTLLI